MIMLSIVLSIYFLVNGFLAGHHWNDQSDFSDEFAERIALIVYTGFLCILGVPFFVLAFIIAVIWAVCEWINSIFLITNWLRFYLTDKWKNLDAEKIQRVEALRKPSTSYSNRNWNRLVDAILRINKK